MILVSLQMNVEVAVYVHFL